MNARVLPSLLSLSCVLSLGAGCHSALDTSDELVFRDQMCEPVDMSLVGSAVDVLDNNWPEIVPPHVRSDWTPEQELQLHGEIVERFEIVFGSMAAEVDQLGCIEVLDGPVQDPEQDAIPIGEGYQVMLAVLDELQAQPELGPMQSLTVQGAADEVWGDATSSWADVEALAGTAVCDEDSADTWLPDCPEGTVFRAGTCDEGESTCGDFMGATRCCDRDAGYMCEGASSCVPRRPGGSTGDGGIITETDGS